MKLIKKSDSHYIIVDDTVVDGDIFGTRFPNGSLIYYDSLNLKTIFEKTTYNICSGNFQSHLCKLITHSTEPLENVILNDMYDEFGWINIKPISLSECQELTKNNTFTKNDIAKVVQYMLQNNISEELKAELQTNFEKGVFLLTEYMIKVLNKLEPTEWNIEIDSNNKITLL